MHSTPLITDCFTKPRNRDDITYSDNAQHTSNYRLLHKTEEQRARSYSMLHFEFKNWAEQKMTLLLAPPAESQKFLPPPLCVK